MGAWARESGGARRDLHADMMRLTLEIAGRSFLSTDLTADAADIARKSGLDISSEDIVERMAEFRRMVVEDGLGMVFPDYNSCLIERKPQRKGAAS